MPFKRSKFSKGMVRACAVISSPQKTAVQRSVFVVLTPQSNPLKVCSQLLFVQNHGTYPFHFAIILIIQHPVKNCTSFLMQKRASTWTPISIYKKEQQFLHSFLFSSVIGTSFKSAAFGSIYCCASNKPFSTKF